MAHDFKSPPGVLSFPHLFTPKPRAQGRPPEYSLSLIFSPKDMDHKNWQAMKQAIYDAAADEFGADKVKDPRFMQTLDLPIREAEKKNYEGYLPGHKYISAWCKEAPQVIDRERLRIVDQSRVFAGQRAVISGRAFGWTNSDKKGVSLFLEHVWIVNENMPRIDGRKAAHERFADDEIEDAITNDDLPF